VQCFTEPVKPFDRMELLVAYSRIVSKFLTSPERAGVSCVDSWAYMNLTTELLQVLQNQHFIDIDNIHCRILDYEKRGWSAGVRQKDITYYKVGKLVFNLLPILLSKLEGSAVQVISIPLRTHPTFRLIKNDPLEFEKAKAAQAIKEFLKKASAV